MIIKTIYIFRWKQRGARYVPSVSIYLFMYTVLFIVHVASKPIYRRESRSYVKSPIDITIKVKIFFSITFNISGDCGFFLSSSIYSLVSSSSLLYATMRVALEKKMQVSGRGVAAINSLGKAFIKKKKIQVMRIEKIAI